MRPASSADIRSVARILAEAFPTLYRSAFGPQPTPACSALLEALYQTGILPLSNMRVCECDGVTAGVAVLHLAGPVAAGSAAEYWRILRGYFRPLHAARAWLGGVLANAALSARMPTAPDLVYVEALAVAEEKRRRGVASALLADAFDFARRHGRTRVALHVLSGNAAARNLYRRHGFVPSAAQRARVLPAGALLLERLVADNPIDA